MKFDAKLDIGRPLAATLILAALLLLGVTLLGSTLADLWAANAERDAKAQFTGRGLAARGNGAASLGAGASLSIVAESETLAAAQIDTLLRSTTADAGASVLSSRAEAKPAETGPPGRIETQAVVEGRIEALQTLLYRLEAGAPLVLVDDLVVEPAPSTVGTGDPQAPILRATMTLSAYWANPRR